MKTEQQMATWVPPGHHYSPIPNRVLVQERRDQVFHMFKDIYGIQLENEKQIALLQQMKARMSKAPMQDKPQSGFRYYYDNPLFGHGDALVLYGLLYHLKPKNIVEIGTGFSTALMLDVNLKEMNGDISISCIESFSGSISAQLRKEKSLHIIDTDLYETDLRVFTSLRPNDILFIDSSHVSKTGSDVNYIIHHILPLLEAGVYVHFHDIMANFEYPVEWVSEGRAWNEAYILRAFLMFNHVYNIVLFNSYLGQFHDDWLRHHIPEFMKNPGGSLWIRKDK